jgi:hypothetical protein
MPRTSWSGNKVWKWRSSKSAKSSSEPERAERAPRSGRAAQVYSPRELTSPYLSEEAHVLSLQHPPTQSVVQPSAPSTSESSLSAASKKSISNSDNSPAGGRKVSPRPKKAGGFGGFIKTKAKKGIEAALRHRRKEACVVNDQSTAATDLEQKEISGNTHDFNSTLEAVGSALRKNELGSNGTFPREDPRVFKHPWHLFGKAPWHRKESGETVSSVTSSVMEVLRPKTPPVTPLLELMTDRSTSPLLSTRMRGVKRVTNRQSVR